MSNPKAFVNLRFNGPYADDPYFLAPLWVMMNQVNPWHWWQAAGNGAPLGRCNVYVQPDRDTIQQQLTMSFEKIMDHLGYPLKPIYITDEYHPVPGYGYDVREQQFQTDLGHLVEFGKRATSLIEADVDVSLAGANVGGLVTDTIEFTITTTVSADEIGVFFRTADGADEAASDNWRIIPQRVVQNSGGTAVTITIHKSALVKPDDYLKKPYEDADNLERNAATTDEATDYVTDLDIYRVYTDPTEGVQMLSYNTADRDTWTVTNANALLVDPEYGRFQLDYSTSCPSNLRQLRVSYKAGYALRNGRMNHQLADAVVRLTNADMREQVTAICQPSTDIWATDRENFADRRRVANEWGPNPFGTLNGQVTAWQTIYNMRQVRGASLRGF